MRLGGLFLFLFLLSVPAAAGKITTSPVCPGFYAQIAQFFSPRPVRKHEAFPFDLAALEAAIRPERALSGHKGLVNEGLWHYSEKGRRYFVKSLGRSSGATRQEIENAKTMGRIGIGPQTHSFQDDQGTDYLIFDHVPGVNGKGFNPKLDQLVAPPEAQEEIRRSLHLSPDLPWAEVEKEYFAELYARRFEAARKLKEIRQALFDHDFYHLQDFQFMIHFEKGVPGVEIQVIDSAYFFRRRPRDEQDTLTAPLDKWIRLFERWQPQKPELHSLRDPQLPDMVEPHPLAAAQH